MRSTLHRRRWRKRQHVERSWKISSSAWINPSCAPSASPTSSTALSPTAVTCCARDGEFRCYSSQKSSRLPPSNEICFACLTIVVRQHTVDAPPSTGLGKLRCREAMSCFIIIFQAAAASALYSITGIDPTVTADLRSRAPRCGLTMSTHDHTHVQYSGTVEPNCGRRCSENGGCCAVWSGWWAIQSHLPRGNVFSVYMNTCRRGRVTFRFGHCVPAPFAMPPPISIQPNLVLYLLPWIFFVYQQRIPGAADDVSFLSSAMDCHGKLPQAEGGGHVG